ncbi:hypothetical protein APV28_0523 [Comamonas testosteroni]|nr:hypothetical protein APV28_0523 [Comamonas testosteroni]
MFACEHVIHAAQFIRPERLCCRTSIPVRHAEIRGEPIILFYHHQKKT